MAPNTPQDRRDLIAELDHYAALLHVDTRLAAYNDAIRTIEEGSANAHYFLLRLDPAASRVVVKGYKLSELSQAEKDYAEAEKYAKEHPGTDAVLVAVDSIAALKRAYPNYFADTRVFLVLLQQALSGHQRRIFSGDLKLGNAS